MTTFRCLIVAVLLSPVGCSWIEKWKTDNNTGPRPGGKLPDVNPNQLVGFINDRASRLQSLQYDDVRIRVYEKGIPLPGALDGHLACSQPRNFRMDGQGRAANAKFDLGSNPEQFWVFVQVPTEKPMYVFASHYDFESGRARLPGGIPFESDWVMQALGMTTLPVLSPPAKYDVSINDRERTYTLSWPATTPAGLQVKKEIIFEGDSATSTRPQIKKHVMRDLKTNKVLCYAEIKAAHTHQIGSDPKTGHPLAIQYPTSVILKWEEQKFEMDLTLEKARVNQTISPEEANKLFTRPIVPNVQAVDLAKYEFK
jgi:hypothetical protein